MKPVMPSIDLKNNVDHMKNQVGVQLHTIKDKDVQGDLDQPCWPTQDVLTNGQPHTNQAENHTDGLNPCHGLPLTAYLTKIVSPL